MIIQDYSKIHNHWNSIESLSQWMEKHDVPGLYGIDTRELTKKLRENGSMLGKIVNQEEIEIENINKRNLVAEVSTKKLKLMVKMES